MPPFDHPVGLDVEETLPPETNVDEGVGFFSGSQVEVKHYIRELMFHANLKDTPADAARKQAVINLRGNQAWYWQWDYAGESPGD